MIKIVIIMDTNSSMYCLSMKGANWATLELIHCIFTSKYLRLPQKFYTQMSGKYPTQNILLCFLSVHSVFSVVVILSFCTFLLSSCNLNVPEPPLRDLPQNALLVARDEALDHAVFIESDWLNEEWWQLFEDEQLNEYIALALEDHPNIKKAVARVELAITQRNKARAPLLPTLNFDADSTRWRNSKNGIFGLAPNFPLKYTQKEGSFNYNLELDFWGKRINQTLAAADEIQASLAELYSARLLLSLSVAETYFWLQTNLVRQKLAEQLLSNRQRQTELSKKRVSNGLDTSLTYNTTLGNEFSAKQFAAAISQNVELNYHALQALIAGNFDVFVPMAQVDQTVCHQFPLPSSLPMDLLAHRPDIQAQRWRVDEAARQINVAYADFFPNVNLLGFVGLQTIHRGNIFTHKSLYYEAGPAIHLPIFQGGLLEANYEASQQQYVIEIAQYENLVLSAVKEVLNALSVLQYSTEQYTQSKAVAEQRRKVYELTKKRLLHNLSGSLDVLAAEEQWITAQDNETQALAAALIARLQLIQALGGGYESCPYDYNLGLWNDRQTRS